MLVWLSFISLFHNQVASFIYLEAKAIGKEGIDRHWICGIVPALSRLLWTTVLVVETISLIL